MTRSYKKTDDFLDKKPIKTFPDEGKIRFGERLKEAIGNESILSFAKKCGLSDTLIGRYIKGTSHPSVDKLPQIARACGKPISWFFSEEQPPEDLVTPPHSEQELQEWWGIISKAMTLSELTAAVETFKKGGKSSLFTPLMEDGERQRLNLSQSSINTALVLEALPDAERKEILARYGINEQAGPVAPEEEPHKSHKKAG